MKHPISTEQLRQRATRDVHFHAGLSFSEAPRVIEHSLVAVLRQLAEGGSEAASDANKDVTDAFVELIRALEAYHSSFRGEDFDRFRAAFACENILYCCIIVIEAATQSALSLSGRKEISMGTELVHLLNEFLQILFSGDFDDPIRDYVTYIEESGYHLDYRIGGYVHSALKGSGLKTGS